MKAYGPTRLEFAAFSSKKEQVQSLAASGYSPKKSLALCTGACYSVTKSFFPARLKRCIWEQSHHLAHIHQQSGAIVWTPSSNDFGILVPRTRDIANSHLVIRSVLSFGILPKAHPCSCSIRGETQVL